MSFPMSWVEKFGNFLGLPEFLMFAGMSVDPTVGK